MNTTVRQFRAGVLAIGAVCTLQGCATGCDTVGCVNGFRVVLSALPSGPFQVELLVAGVVQGTAVGGTCSLNTGCTQDIRFNTEAQDHVSVRVSTATGIRVTSLGHVNYTKSYPNGKSCNLECHNATVAVSAS